MNIYIVNKTDSFTSKNFFSTTSELSSRATSWKGLETLVEFHEFTLTLERIRFNSYLACCPGGDPSSEFGPNPEYSPHVSVYTLRRKGSTYNRTLKGSISATYLELQNGSI